MHTRGIIVFSLLLLAISTAWAAEKPYAGVGDIEQVVSERSETEIQWNLEPNKTPETMPDLEPMLQKKLSVHEAVRIALLKNPTLQAAFERLGIANADLAAAKLVENPIFKGGVGFPVLSSGAQTSADLSLTQNILDVIQRPLRKKAASARLEVEKLNLANSVLILIAEVKEAYYAYQGALHMQGFRQSIVSTSQAAVELAKGQLEAGNISSLDVDQQLALYHAAKLELEKSKSETKVAREELARLMGITGIPTQWKIIEKLPPLPRKDPILETLETVAVSQRLDLAASKKRIEASRHAVNLANSYYVPSLAVGIRGDIDEEGNNSVGPTVSVGLPIFGQRKVARARAEALLRQSERESTALVFDIKSELKRAYEEFLLARQTANYYQSQILPLSKRIVDESLKHYNYMLLSNYQLIQAKQNQISAQRDYINALRDYWMTRSELERIVGGTLNAQPPPESTKHQGGEVSPAQERK
jgi:cobalt-zinc-cadmium efflux system outer membrane protein